MLHVKYVEYTIYSILLTQNNYGIASFVFLKSGLLNVPASVTNKRLTNHTYVIDCKYTIM